jgi:anti-sigma-K factor RskA
MSGRRPVRPADVALDLVDERDRAAAERLLAEDPHFRAETERLRALAETLAQLDLQGWRPAAPPPLDDDRALLPVRHAAAARRAWVPRHRGAGVALAAAAALAAVVLALVAGGRRDRPPATTLTLQPLRGVSGHATLTLSGDRAELRGKGMPPSGSHDYYEAWLADAGGRMVSMGTFRVRPDGSVDARMPVAVDGRRYRLVDVSLEPDDGDPTHSTRSVMRARL